MLAACVAPDSEPSRNGTTLTPSSEPAGSDPTTTGVVTVPGTDGASTTQATTPGTGGSTTPTTQAATTAPPAPTGSSLRFFGTGSGQVDRVKIPIDSAVNVGATDFTIEVWIHGNEADNDPAGSCGTGEAAWITGNIFIDRDVFNGGDRGDYGLSLYDGRVAFGATRGSSGSTICGGPQRPRRRLAPRRRHPPGLPTAASSSTSTANSTPRPPPAAPPATSPTGSDASTEYPDSDPYLVLAAEKHDAGSGFPSFDGYLDELRLSTNLRYAGNFTRPAGPFSPDGNTAALYHFDEGSGTTANDELGASDGELRVGGATTAPSG